MASNSKNLAEFLNPDTSVSGDLDVTNGTIKLDGNYPVGTGNVALGDAALGSGSLSGGYNTAVGYQAGLSNTTGSDNVFAGLQAGFSNTTGTGNLAAGGNSPLRSNTTGNRNVALGYSALYSNTTASYNTAVGYQSGYNITTGGFNTILGYGAGDAANISESVIIGYNAGTAATGNQNTIVGSEAGKLITSGAKNTILGRYNGNQDGLDIRTSDNNIVLSDGDGRPHKYSQLAGNLMANGVGHFENVLYEGNATGWDSTSSANTWTTITAIDFNDGILRNGNGVIVKIMLYTTNLNPTYGYYTLSLAHILNTASNTSYTGSTTATSDGTGSKGYELPVTSQCHTATSILDLRLRIANVSGVGNRLQVYSNATPSASAAAPTLKISATAHDHY